jgi:hypothetical protein
MTARKPWSPGMLRQTKHPQCPTAQSDADYSERWFAQCDAGYTKPHSAKPGRFESYEAGDAIAVICSL